MGKVVALAKPKTLDDDRQLALEVDQIVKERSKGNQPEGFHTGEICPVLTGGEFRVTALPNTERKCFRCCESETVPSGRYNTTREG